MKALATERLLLNSAWHLLILETFKNGFGYHFKAFIFATRLYFCMLAFKQDVYAFFFKLYFRLISK